MSTETVPGTPRPVPAHQDVTQFTDVFGSAALMPYWNPVSALDRFAFMLASVPPYAPASGTTTGPSLDATGLDADGFPANIVLRRQLPVGDATVDSFFDPLRQLCGQSVPALSAAYDTVATYATHLDDMTAQVQQAVNMLFTAWDGDAKAACEKYAGDYVSFATSQRDMCTKLCECYVATASIITAARNDLVKNAATFVTAVENLLWPKNDGSGLNFGLSLLLGIAGAVASIGTAGTAAPAVGALIAGVTSVTATVAGKLINDHYKSTATFADCVSSYDGAARQILEGIGPALAEVSDRLRFVVRNAPIAPKAPMTAPTSSADTQLVPQ